ncbi:MAG: UDP-N-acetylmuramoyl-L-alanyl-D-glutamate--2,6-diaminopimelate ligase [Trueperaceae bacterium]
MTLAELLADALGTRLTASPPKIATGANAATTAVAAAAASAVTGVSQDHRKVAPGHIFIARVGAKFDGHRYARLAIERGAIAVVGVLDAGPTLPWGATPYVRVSDDRVAVARLAAAFHGHPSRSLTTVGITGTDGKTTVSTLLHHLLSAGVRCGLISTAGVRAHDVALPLEGHFTTPEASEVQGYLAAFRDARCTHVVLESSSHALAMHRLDEVDYDVAVWTNLSAEHLDYHGSLEAYREAKLQLVRRAPVAVLNRDDPEFAVFSKATAGTVIDYGLHDSASWRAEAVKESPAGLAFDVRAGAHRCRAFLPMLGTFNVHNALAALAAASHLGVELELLVERLANFPGVPGRMQMIQSTPFAVVIDFAHTGPALEKALAALRPAVRGRILLVVGAAGERDPGKRRPLGRAAASGADLTFFTEEDYRSESLEAILDELEAGAVEAGATSERMVRVTDRREAIAAAISRAREGDLVLLAGKGHESTLERGDESLPWDEAEEARRQLR